MIHDVIVKKSFNRSFMSVLLTWITYQISSLLDTMMSGNFFDTDALTAVGLTGTYVLLLYLIMDSLSVGSGICIGNAIGRGDHKQVNEYYSLTVYAMIFTGIVFTFVSAVFPHQIAFLIGARDESIMAYTVSYVRVFGFCTIPYGINYLLQTLLLMFGKKKAYITNSVVFMVANIIASLTFTQVFNMGVEGLALGTLVGNVVSVIQSALCFVGKNKDLISFVWRVNDVRKKIPHLISRCLPTFSNNSTEVVADFVLNNVVAICVGTTGLTILALFYSMKQIIAIVIGALDETVSSCVSVLFGARDINGIKQIMKSSMGIPLLSCLVLTGLMVIFRTPVLGLFGVDDPALVSAMLPYMSVLIVSGFAATITYMLSPLYANTDNPRYGIVCAVVPDTVICLPVACILIALIGMKGLWIAELVSYVAFFGVLYLLIWHKTKKKVKTLDDVMMLPKEYYDDKEVIAISIKKDMDTAVDISQRIQNFLLERGADKKKAYYAALCTEELSALVKEAAKGNHESYIDIQVFMSKQSIKLSIRDNGPKCNYLLHDPEDPVSGIGIKIVRNIAKDVSYTNLIGMNLLNVEI